MIKLVNLEYVNKYLVKCEFSDYSVGFYDFEPLLFKHETELTIPLREIAAFRKFFIISGALCWSNGLELDPKAIHDEMKRDGRLQQISKAA